MNPTSFSLSIQLIFLNIDNADSTQNE